jgi:hypothetical protein
LWVSFLLRRKRPNGTARIESFSKHTGDKPEKAGEQVTPITVHMLDGIVSNPMWLSAFLVLALCSRTMTVCERAQAIWINALLIERLRAAIATPVSSSASLGEVRTRECYGARVRYEAHRAGKSTRGSRSNYNA